MIAKRNACFTILYVARINETLIECPLRMISHKSAVIAVK